MHLHASAARHRLGSLLGGEAGDAMLREAEETMKAQGVRAPRSTRECSSLAVVTEGARLPLARTRARLTFRHNLPSVSGPERESRQAAKPPRDLGVGATAVPTGTWTEVTEAQ